MVSGGTAMVGGEFWDAARKRKGSELRDRRNEPSLRRLAARFTSRDIPLTLNARSHAAGLYPEKLPQPRQIQTTICRPRGLGRIILGRDRYDSFDGQWGAARLQASHDCYGEPVPTRFTRRRDIDRTLRRGETLRERRTASVNDPGDGFGDYPRRGRRADLIGNDTQFATFFGLMRNASQEVFSMRGVDP